MSKNCILYDAEDKCPYDSCAECNALCPPADDTKYVFRQYNTVYALDKTEYCCNACKRRKIVGLRELAESGKTHSTAYCKDCDRRLFDEQSTN